MLNYLVMDLFSQNESGERRHDRDVPLAERRRPQQLADFKGHEKIIGVGTALREAINRSRLKSLILWGPPGVGKTTLARVLSTEVNAEFISLSAVTAGVADIRKSIEKARGNRKYYNRATVLFIDEIHRFNKAQQDALLHVVEDGTVILIGATTENPSFEVIAPLLSRCQVYVLNPLNNETIRDIVETALKNDPVLIEKQINIKDWEALYILADGDARRALNALEKAVDFLESEEPPLVITRETLEKAVLKKILAYDKKGEHHYNVISAFIKSLRGSDPDAAVYWMARMLVAGEDPKFIARRMLILASEDIGNADPMALVIATSCFTAITYVGMPECQIILGHAATYLAAAPKSNAAYKAISAAMDDVRNLVDEAVPKHLRNAPTGLMKHLDYGKDYRYVHNHENHFVGECYLPEAIKERIYYTPTTMGEERKIRERLSALWSDLKRYTEPDKQKDTLEK